MVDAQGDAVTISTADRITWGVAVAAALAAAVIGLRGDDVPFFLAINAASFAVLGPIVASCATILGHGLVALMVLAPAAIRSPQLLAAGLFATPIAALLTHLPKYLVAEPRPAAVLDPSTFHVVGPTLAGMNSFASGHTITAFTVAAVAAFGAPAVQRRPLLVVPVLLAAAAVAWSRIAVGAHWPFDVLSGSVLGIVAGRIGVGAARRWRFWERRGGALALAAVVGVCAIVLAALDLGYPLARPLQWLLAAVGFGAALVALRGELKRAPSMTLGENR